MGSESRNSITPLSDVFTKLKLFSTTF